MSPMDCSEARDLLQALEDDEVQPAERAAILLHLHGCPACSAALVDLRSLRGRIQAAGTFAMPAGLDSRMRAAIGLESRRRSGRGWQWYAAAAASHGAVALLGALLAYWAAIGVDARRTAARDVVAAHVRSLLDDRLVQVASADTHTVKPWFAGRVPFSPEVVDLTPRGFPLIGGRVDFVLQRPAAALVYERRKHRINVFVLPQDLASTGGAFETALSGYNVLAWSSGGFAYFAAADLNPGELAELAAALGADRPR